VLAGTNSRMAKEHVGQRPTQQQEQRISFQWAKKRQNKRNQGEDKGRKGCCAHGISVNKMNIQNRNRPTEIEEKLIFFPKGEEGR